MANTTITDIEKRSLEVHVDLCAERFKDLRDDLEVMSDRISKLESDMATRMDKLEVIVTEIKDTLAAKETSALKTLIALGISIITALLGVSGGLLWYIITT